MSRHKYNITWHQHDVSGTKNEVVLTCAILSIVWRYITGTLLLYMNTENALIRMYMEKSLLTLWTFMCLIQQG